MPLDLTRIRAVLFDIDGTLSDTDDLWVSRLDHGLSGLRRFFPGQETRRFSRRVVMGLESPANGIYAFFDRIGIDAPLLRLMHGLPRPHRQKNPGDFRIIPGVTGLLEALAGRYPLGVVTARDEDSAMAFLEHFQLKSYFQAIATAQTCRYTKPYPDPVLWAAEKCCIRPQECLMVGDTTVDIRAGRAAGAQTAGVLCGFGTERELRRAKADEVFQSTADLGSLLLQNDSKDAQQGPAVL